MIVRSVCNRGLGVHVLGEAAGQLATGTQIFVRLPGFGSLLELPGRIVWSDRKSEPAAFGRIGIVLFVEIVPAATRSLFATWLTDAASRQQRQPVPSAPRAPRASLPGAGSSAS